MMHHNNIYSYHFVGIFSYKSAMWARKLQFIPLLKRKELLQICSWLWVSITPNWLTWATSIKTFSSYSCKAFFCLCARLPICPSSWRFACSFIHPTLGPSTCLLFEMSDLTTASILSHFYRGAWEREREKSGEGAFVDSPRAWMTTSDYKVSMFRQCFYM